MRARANAAEDELATEKAIRDSLNAEVADGEIHTEKYLAEAAKLRADAEAMINATIEGRAAEDLRKEAVRKAVVEADSECKEVEGLRQSITDLTATQEKNAEELKQTVANKDVNLNEMQMGIESTLSELKSVEDRSREAELIYQEKQIKFSKEMAAAKKDKEIIEAAFRRAQVRAEDFAVQPDDELAAEMKQLEEDEEAIINETDIERAELIASKLLLLCELMPCIFLTRFTVTTLFRGLIFGEHSV
jgi:ribosomal protein L21